jgi:protein gp37
MMGYSDKKPVLMPYPFGFQPTFHRYRLGEPSRKTNPQNIFVCSMADLFGEWVPDEWVKEVFTACETAPQHTYMFLTKNPSRYIDLQFTIPLPTAHKYWYGTTANCLEDFRLGSKAHYLSNLNGCKKFLSIEPLMSDIGSLGLANLHRYDWVIIGAQTGPGSVPPKSEWIQSIIDQCRAAGVPVFLKDNLNWPDKIQEYPW